MDQAFARWNSRTGVHYEPTEEEEQVPDPVVELGQRYNHSDAIAYVNGAKGSIYEDPFWPTSFPGSRAPHIWLNSVRKSLYDNFEVDKYVLLCTGKGEAWRDAVEIYAKSLPLKYAVITGGEFLTKYKIRDNGAVLIRPDGIIGWKALNDTEVWKLGSVVRQLLCLEEATDEVAPLPSVARSKTTPDLGGMMGKMSLDSKDTSPKKTGGGGLLRRMTTMRKTKK